MQKVVSGDVIKRFKDTHQSLEMLHEYLQTDIVREDGLSASCRCIAVHASRHVCCRGIELGEEETSLRSTLIADDVTRDGEALRKEILNNCRT